MYCGGDVYSNGTKGIILDSRTPGTENMKFDGLAILTGEGGN